MMLEVLKDIVERIFKDVRFFRDVKNLEIIGTYLDIEIRGSDRRDIKVTTVDKTHRKNAFSSIDTYYKFEFREEKGKLVISNYCNIDISPAHRCRLIAEIPREMPVKVSSMGHALLGIADMNGKLELDLDLTGANLLRVRDLKATLRDRSRIIMQQAKSGNVELEINSSNVDMLNTVEVGKLDAKMDRSALESDGIIREAMVYVGGGCKLRIQKITNSPMIVGDERLKNDVKIVEVGVE